MGKPPQKRSSSTNSYEFVKQGTFLLAQEGFFVRKTQMLLKDNGLLFTYLRFIILFLE